MPEDDCLWSKHAVIMWPEFVQWRTERRVLVFNPPPRNSKSAPKSCQTQPYCENC